MISSRAICSLAEMLMPSSMYWMRVIYSFASIDATLVTGWCLWIAVCRSSTYPCTGSSVTWFVFDTNSDLC